MKEAQPNSIENTGSENTKMDFKTYFSESNENFGNLNLYARMINTSMKKNQLPKHWTYEGLGKMKGAQVLSPVRAITMAVTGQDPKDDWFQQKWSYSHVAFLNVSETTGETGGIGYTSVPEGAVEDMWVIPIDRLRQVIEKIKAEKDLEDKFWYDLWEDEILELLLPHLEKVQPEWVETI